MEIVTPILFYILLFGLPIVLPIGIVKVLSLFTKDKKVYYYEYNSTIETNENIDNILNEHKIINESKHTFVTITKCAYCDCVDSYVRGVCIHCGGSQQIRVKEEIK